MKNSVGKRGVEPLILCNGIKIKNLFTHFDNEVYHYGTLPVILILVRNQHCSSGEGEIRTHNLTGSRYSTN